MGKSPIVKYLFMKYLKIYEYFFKQFCQNTERKKLFTLKTLTCLEFWMYPNEKAKTKQENQMLFF